MAVSWVIEINKRVATRFPRGFACFSHIKTLLGRTETRTLDRRRSNKNCDLRFANADIFNENYSIDVRYNTANNVSNCGGDPMTQLIVNVYQMIKV